ncbi:MAG: aminotransferase class V-fold PLP-dependent enzyme [Planctomycetes bacterium]|nr:aminotransferase class V-fold PLP-dependent enzyme [Planctomycetota bacterium]
MERPIYMDYQATTPVDPRVLEAMLPYFSERFGNAASGGHAFGWEAQAAVKRAREICAKVLGAEPMEIVFTSGSTEGIGLALKGAAESCLQRGRHIVTCATEHPAVIDTVRHLAARGLEVTWLPVDREGSIDLRQLAAALTERTILVALMAANNEIGTLHPIADIGRVCRERGVLFFCDATQGVGKIPIDVRRDAIDILSFSAHKLYGPKGAGALYVRGKDPPVRLAAQTQGGGQERGMRPGTLNVPGIVGLGRACEVAAEELSTEAARLTRLRRRLHDGITRGVAGVALNGPAEKRLPGNLNLWFEGVDSAALMMEMKEVAVSSGSACASTEREPSHVLKAIGASDRQAHSSLRFGLGRMTTEWEVDRVVELTVRAVRRLRESAP